MLDPYPFGGGVTILEATAVSTPFITLPSRQTVPALASGMLRKMAQVAPELQDLAVSNLSDLANVAKALMNDLSKYRRLVSNSMHMVFNDSTACKSWETFFRTSIKNIFSVPAKELASV